MKRTVMIHEDQLRDLVMGKAVYRYANDVEIVLLLHPEANVGRAIYDASQAIWERGGSYKRRRA